MVEELDTFDSTEKLSFSDAEVFLFEVSGKNVIVAWSENDVVIDLSEYFDDSVRVRHIVTALDEYENPVYVDDEIFSPSTVNIGHEPVFIKEASD